MEDLYFSRLPLALQNIVLEIEAAASFDVTVKICPWRDKTDSQESQPLRCVVDETEARILIPSLDQFRPSSVLHELLHLRRFLIQCVPQINVCERFWTLEAEAFFAELDNSLEHFLIIPEEIRWYPERLAQWITKMNRNLDKVETGSGDADDREFDAVYSLALIEHAIPDNNLKSRSRALLSRLSLMDRAISFRNAIIPTLSDKEAATAVFVEHFSLDREMICLKYLDPINRTHELKKLMQA